MKALFKSLSLCFLSLGLASLAKAAPPILNYSGQVAVDGAPFTGTAYLKFAFVDGSGQFSYWSHDGTSANGSEPDGNVSVSVSGGLYSIMIGDTQIAGMGEVDESVFQNHNDVHLRVWFSDGVNEFEQITPDRRFASVPYVLGNDGTGDANFASSGTENNSTQRVTEAGGYVRLVANGPDTPSGTLVLLNGDTAEVLAYVGEDVGLLEYSFGEHGFVLPKTFDSFRQTLIGPGSVRLVATTGSKSFANLRVHRANGRDHLDLDGGATSGSEPPAIVSIPKEQTVVLGGRTTLFVSASGDNLTYQWKKDGVDLSGENAAALTFEEARPQDSGNYTVVVGNADGNVTSSVAQLVVDTLMKRVETGTYRINADPDNTGHEVRLSAYLIDMFEVRMSYWEEVYEWATKNGYSFTNPGLNTDAEGNPQSGNHPVHSINWYDCVKWANARSEKDGFDPCYYAEQNRTTVYRTGEINLTNFHVDWTASGYRLPTEAEWEVAARGGLVANKYSWGNSPFPSKANYVDTRIGKTVAVGTFDANGYGIHDIGGNLREWTWDWYDDRTYEYDWKETFPDANGYYDLVDEETTTSIFTNQGYSGFDKRHYNLISTSGNDPAEIYYDFSDTNDGNGIVIPEIYLLARADGGTTQISIEGNFTYEGEPDRVLTNGDIGNSQQSWMQTKVVGPVTVTFDWKVSSEPSYDSLRFYIDGAEQNRISGTAEWQTKTYNLSTGEHILKWTYSKDSSGDRGSDSGSVRNLSILSSNPPDYQPSPIRTAFAFNWESGGNAVWQGFSEDQVSGTQGFSAINASETASFFSLKHSIISSTIDLLGLTVKVTNSSGTGYVYLPKVLTQDANETNHQAFLDLKLPSYEENYLELTNELDVNADYSQYSFELLDGGNQVRDSSDFGRPISMGIDQQIPPAIRYHIPPPTTKDSIGSTIISILFKTNDPKSLWTGNNRIVKDIAYNEGLSSLKTRYTSLTPLTRNSDSSSNFTASHLPRVGFRLVRRP